MNAQIRSAMGLLVLLVGSSWGHAKQDGVIHAGIDEGIIDSNIHPCNDFYQFSCGKWLEQAKIPADLPMWDRSFMAMREKNRLSLKKILESYAAGKTDKPKNPYAKKLGDFYSTCMDEGSIERTSLADLKAQLAKIDALTLSDIKKQLATLLAHLHLSGVNAFFEYSEQQDFKDATQVIGAVDQGGLSLPDRDYYLKSDDKTVEVKNKFEKYAQNILEMMGEPAKNAKAQVHKIIEIETFLAKNSMSRVDRRNPFNVYHRLDRKGLKQKAPQFDWDHYFNQIGTPDVQAINVTAPDFFIGLNELLSLEKSGISMSDLQTYLKWHLISASIPAMPKKFVEENFRFISSALSGQQEIESRWKRCVKMADGFMGFALGRSFVELNYGSEGKEMTQNMIQNIEKAFESELKDLSWMDDATKKQASKKLHKIVNKVGYPDHWRNYDGFKVDRKSFLNTFLNGSKFNTEYYLNKIGKPLDRKEWEMTPPTVNAYYNPSLNEMVFPAGILETPFFNRHSLHSVNYGGIGMVMGHELTHGFDDSGRHYDAEGNLEDWWTQTVSKEFEEKAKCVVKQYDRYEPLPGVNLNGRLTLGENIADLGGLRLAYKAWFDTRPKVSKKPASISSKYTDEQMFFISFAQSWCSKKQEQYARLLVTTDPHSPPRFRVNGSVSQFPKFAEAFQCKAGAPMAPVERCEVW